MTIQFCNGEYVPDYDPTIENLYLKQYEKDGDTFVLRIFDTGGAEYSAGALEWREKIIRMNDGFMFVYSVDNRDSFKEVAEIHSHVIHVMGHEQKVPMVVVAAKADLGAHRQVFTLEGLALAEKFGCPYVEASAKTGSRVQEAFHTLVLEIKGAHKKTKPSKHSKSAAKCSIL